MNLVSRIVLKLGLIQWNNLYSTYFPQTCILCVKCSQFVMIFPVVSYFLVHFWPILRLTCKSSSKIFRLNQLFFSWVVKIAHKSCKQQLSSHLHRIVTFPINILNGLISGLKQIHFRRHSLFRIPKNPTKMTDSKANKIFKRKKFLL